MNRTRPYLNRFVKQKELQLADNYHGLNMRDIKPITTRLMEPFDVPINNSKREMIREVRDIEIERENKLLLGKIERVMQTKGNYSVARTRSLCSKTNKSLNDNLRRRQLDSIESENKKFLMRLQSKKATLDNSKLQREWQDNKSVIKRMANCQFNLTHFKSTNTHLRSLTSERLSRLTVEDIRFSRTKTIDGQRMAIRVEFADGMLKVVGDCRDQKDLKVIEIPREEAVIFVEKECEGKAERLLDKLKYDRATETLYLLSETIQDSPNPEKASRKGGLKIPVKTHSNIEYTPKIGKDNYHYQVHSQRAQVHSEREAVRPPSNKGPSDSRVISQSEVKEGQSNGHSQQQQHPSSQDAIEDWVYTLVASLFDRFIVPQPIVKEAAVVMVEAEESYNQQFEESRGPANVETAA